MARKVLVIVAHPDLPVSRVNRRLAGAAASVDGVAVHDLYAAYPEMFIDGGEERKRLAGADAIVLQFPIYWYAGPGLLKEWMDRTLTAGWAYGRGGTALHGKLLQVSITTGSPQSAYDRRGVHGHPISDYIKPYRQTAVFCGMDWGEPLIFHHARSAPDDKLDAHANLLIGRLQALSGGEA